VNDASAIGAKRANQHKYGVQKKSSFAAILEKVV